MNRRKPALLLWAACLLLLASCGSPEPAETEWSELQMAQAIWDTQEGLRCETLLHGEEDFNRYLTDAYGIASSDVAGGAVLYAGGVNAQEIAVLRLADAGAAKEAGKALEAYINVRAGAFNGYAPEQYAIVEKSGTASRGAYIALLICPGQDTAKNAFGLCFTAPPPKEAMAPDPNAVVMAPAPVPEPAPEPLPEPEPAPETDPEWVYDASRIAAAWASGEREGIRAEDLAILSVLDEIPALTDPGLTDCQRELALHDWMLAWGEYDPGALSSGPIGDPIPHNDNPYGFLVGRKGICLGYSSTFQLLMDLSGIECLTVPGTAHAGTDDHAWNLVKLDGEWYAVDVTWDDPVASFPVSDRMAHRYFNVTSDFLRENDHQWDASAAPEATGTALSWAG